VDLANVKTFVPVYDWGRGSFVGVYWKRNNLALAFQANLKDARGSLLVPGTLADEQLERPFWIGAGQALGQGDAAGEGLDGLALAVEEKALGLRIADVTVLGIVLGRQVKIVLWKIKTTIGRPRRNEGGGRRDAVESQPPPQEAAPSNEYVKLTTASAAACSTKTSSVLLRPRGSLGTRKCTGQGLVGGQGEPRLPSARRDVRSGNGRLAR
jgi:hypothetical protein